MPYKRRKAWHGARGWVRAPRARAELLNWQKHLPPPSLPCLPPPSPLPPSFLHSVHPDTVYMYILILEHERTKSSAVIPRERQRAWALPSSSVGGVINIFHTPNCLLCDSADIDCSLSRARQRSNFTGVRLTDAVKGHQADKRIAAFAFFFSTFAFPLSLSSFSALTCYPHPVFFHRFLICSFY